MTNKQLHSDRLRIIAEKLASVSEDFSESYHENDLYFEDLDIEIHEAISDVFTLFEKYINIIKGHE